MQLDRGVFGDPATESFPIVVSTPILHLFYCAWSRLMSQCAFRHSLCNFLLNSSMEHDEEAEHADWISRFFGIGPVSLSYWTLVYEKFAEAGFVGEDERLRALRKCLTIETSSARQQSIFLKYSSFQF